MSFGTNTSVRSETSDRNEVVQRRAVSAGPAHGQSHSIGHKVDLDNRLCDSRHMVNVSYDNLNR